MPTRPTGTWQQKKTARTSRKELLTKGIESGTGLGADPTPTGLDFAPWVISGLELYNGDKLPADPGRTLAQEHTRPTRLPKIFFSMDSCEPAKLIKKPTVAGKISEHSRKPN